MRVKRINVKNVLTTICLLGVVGLVAYNSYDSVVNTIGRRWGAFVEWQDFRNEENIDNAHYAEPTIEKNLKRELRNLESEINDLESDIDELNRKMSNLEDYIEGLNNNRIIYYYD